MKEKIKKMIGFAVLFLLIYPFGVVLAITFLLLRWLKYIRVLHWERFPHFKEGIILVANHPSMLDPFLLTALFYKGYLLNPLKYGPLLVADKKNFWDSWYWFWSRPFLIPVDRGNRQAEVTAFRCIKEALDKGRVVVIFPEGGRTCWGEKKLHSASGKEIRTLMGGVGLLVRKTKAMVIPVWIERTEEFLPNSKDKNRLFTRLRFPRKKTMLVKIGEPLHFQTAACREEVSQVIASSLLELADEYV